MGLTGLPPGVQGPNLPGSTPQQGPPPPGSVNNASSAQSANNPYNPNDPTYRGAGLNQLNDYFNQSNAGLNMQRGFNADKFNLGQSLNAYKGNFLNQNEGFLNQGYQNSLAKLGLQQGDLNNQIGYQSNRVNDYGSILDNLNKLFGNNAQSLQAQLGQINLGETQAHQKAQSAGVTGGSMFSPGYGVGQQQISQESGYARTLAELQSAKSDISTQDQILNTRMRQDVEKSNLATMQSKAAEFGIDAKDLYLGLQKGLAQSGLDKFTNINDLMSMTQSKNAAEVSLSHQALADLYKYGADLQNSGNISPEELQAWTAQHANWAPGSF